MSAAILWLAGFGVFAASPPLASGPKPFLSKCAEITVTNAPKEFNRVWTRPTKDGVESPFYDEPFALHVPFEVRHDGGPATVTWNATVIWENPPAVWSEHPDLFAGQFGLYRADGHQPTPGSIRDGANGFYQWEPNQPVPTASSFLTSPDGKRNWQAGSVKITAERGAHKSFADSGRSLLLNPAQPGTHVLWLALNTRNLWPEKEPMRDAIRGKFFVDVVVSRGDRGVSSDEIAYLFGKGKRPAAMLEDKFFWATTMELPFTLRRDGWEFDHIEVKLRDQYRERVEKKWESYQESWARSYDVPAPAVNGKVVTVHVGEKSYADRRASGNPRDASGWDTVWDYAADWKIAFPQTFLDASFAELTFSGSRERKLTQKPAWQVSDPGPTFSWYVPLPGTGGSEASSGGRAFVSWILYPLTQDAPDAAGLAEYRTRFLGDYGADAAEWFKPVWFPKAGSLPKPGEIYRCYGRSQDSPKVHPAGAVAIAGYIAGPWQINAFYKRLREVEDRVVASRAVTGEPTVVSDKDKFWEWYVKFSFLLLEQLPKARHAQINAIQEAVTLPELLQTRDRLRFVLLPDAGLPPWRGMQRVWNTKDKFWIWMDNDFPKLNVGTMPGGSEPGSVNVPVATSPELAARMQKKLQTIAAEIGQHRDAIEKFTEEARACYDVILAKLDEGYAGYGGPGHPELTLYKKDYRDQRDRARLDIAVSVNDPEFLKKALETSAIEGESPNTRAIEAQLYRASGDAISAWAALQRGLSIEPDHAICKEMLKDVECAFIQRAIEKSQGAIADARRHFYGYLMERGFSDTDILAGKTNRLDWMATRIGVYGEEAWAVFTTGLFGSFSAFYGKPAAEAELLATTERQMTTAFVGLHTMRLLRKKNVTFEEMKTITSPQIRDKLGMYDARGNPLSDADAANVGVAVREAMKLPDVQALMAGSREALEAGVQQGYWDSADVSNTWIEWFGDLTSAYNLFTLALPFAKAGTAGRTSSILWEKADLAMINELQQLGVVKSGTEAVATAIGVTRALNAVGAGGRGEKIAEYMARMEKYQSGLGAVDQGIWTVGKITGVMTFGVVSVGATEHLVGHKAAMIVQAALMFAGDTDLLVKLLAGRNIPPDKISRLIISEYLPATQVHLKRLAMVEKSAFELEELLVRVKVGKKLNADDFTLLNRYFGSDWRKITPGANASENAAIAVQASAEGIRSGVDNGALHAAAEHKPMIEAEAKATQQTLQEEQTVADALAAAKTDPNPPVLAQKPATPPVDERLVTAKFEIPPEAAAAERANPATPAVGGAPNRPVTGKPGVPKATPPPPRKLKPPGPLRPEDYPASATRVLPEELRVAPELGGYKKHPPLRPNSQTAVALQALQNGHYVEAESKLIQIQESIRRGVLTEAEEMTMERLHSWRMVANELQRVERHIPLGPSKLELPISSATVDEILNTPGVLKPKVTTGAMSDVFTVEGHPDLFVKRIRAKFKRFNAELKTADVADKMEEITINVLEDVENNLLHEQLARAMNFKVPAMEVRITYDASGQAVEAYYVMRKVEGETLASMTAAEVFLYREELARHRALATLLGDFDRKLDNYIITPEGFFVPIDAGCGDATGARLARDQAKERLPLQPDVPYTIDGVWGRDHWYAKAVDRTQGKDLLDCRKSTYRKLMVAEESMTFQGAEPAVKQIESYFVNGDHAAEAEQLIREAYVKMHLPKGVKRMAELQNVNLADPVARAKLEEVVRKNLEAQIKGATERVQKNLQIRAPKIRESMKIFNERNGQPIYETEPHGALLRENDVIPRLVLNLFPEFNYYALAA